MHAKRQQKENTTDNVQATVTRRVECRCKDNSARNWTHIHFEYTEHSTVECLIVHWISLLMNSVVCLCKLLGQICRREKCWRSKNMPNVWWMVKEVGKSCSIYQTNPKMEISVLAISRLTHGKSIRIYVFACKWIIVVNVYALTNVCCHSKFKLIKMSAPNCFLRRSHKKRKHQQNNSLWLYITFAAYQFTCDMRVEWLWRKTRRQLLWQCASTEAQANKTW